MSLDSETVSKPALAEKRVVVASSPGKLPALVEGLENMGAQVIPFPTIELREITEKAPLDAALDHIGSYSWIIFTSVYGVSFFTRRMRQRGMNSTSLAASKVCAVGPATADALSRSGIQATLVPARYVAEGILEALRGFEGGSGGVAGTRILLPRAREARELLPRELAAAGAHVDVVPCYENVLPEVGEEILRSIAACKPDLLVFTSSSTVVNFVKLLGNERSGHLLAGAATAVLGPITARTLESLSGAPATIIPEANTLRSLLEAVGRYYEARPGTA